MSTIDNLRVCMEKPFLIFDNIKVYSEDHCLLFNKQVRKCARRITISLKNCQNCGHPTCDSKRFVVFEIFLA
jgi:hypothetical protein